VVRKIYAPKRKELAELAGGWRRLHKEELHRLKTSPNINIKQGGRDGGLYDTWEMRNAHKLLVRKT
jgi:hypothetical protein